MVRPVFEICTRPIQAGPSSSSKPVLSSRYMMRVFIGPQCTEKPSVHPEGSPDGCEVVGPDPVDGLVAHAGTAVGHRGGGDEGVSVDGEAGVEELRPPQRS